MGSSSLFAALPVGAADNLTTDNPASYFDGTIAKAPGMKVAPRFRSRLTVAAKLIATP